MADRATINALARQAAASSAKLLLVGDDHQLPAMGADGSFQMLVESRNDTPHLVVMHRFRDPDGSERTWEAEASLQMRLGDSKAIGAYAERGRFRSGETEAMIDAAYAAWKQDRENGVNALLIAADNATVQALNMKAPAERIEAGQVQPNGVDLHDGTAASVGDRIVTRRVDRRLHDGSDGAARPDEYGRYATGFVKNGTTFTVVAVLRDGSLNVQSAPSAQPVVLPAQYVSHHVQLGYSVTAHRCQGMTVDTPHTIASERMAREAFYVAMTRGIRSYRADVTTDGEPESDAHIGFAQARTGRDAVLAAILSPEGAEQSAHAVQSSLARRRESELRRPAPTMQR